jgi:hypothetical protein
MRYLLGLVLACTISCTKAISADKTAPDADKLRLQNQAEALKNAKLKDGEAKAKQVKLEAERQKEAVDKRLQQVHKDIVHHEVTQSFIIGSDVAHHGSLMRKHQANEEAKAKKEQIDADARAKANAHRAAAEKKAAIIDQSVDGLKSQVGTDGKFGLQKKGTSLHVRNYGSSH